MKRSPSTLCKRAKYSTIKPHLWCLWMMVNTDTCEALEWYFNIIRYSSYSKVLWCLLLSCGRDGLGWDKGILALCDGKYCILWSVSYWELRDDSVTERTYCSFAEILCLVPGTPDHWFIAVHKPASSGDLMPVHGHTHRQKHRKTYPLKK